MSCIYGPRQMGTEDQGWVAHFLIRALAASRSPSTATASRCATSSVDDAVDAYVAAWRHIGTVTGRAFNLGGGPTNAVSLLGHAPLSSAASAAGLTSASRTGGPGTSVISSPIRRKRGVSSDWPHRSVGRRGSIA